MMEHAPADLSQRIAQRVRDLRTQRGLSLEALAAKTGVSRSMISLVERGESSPTAVVLEKLATGLGVVLASLFEPPGRAAPAVPLARRKDQPEWRDPESGYHRRNVTPPGPHPFQIVEVHFPAGARVTFEAVGREPVHQQVWVLAGTMEVGTGDERHRLREGDCFAMALDRPNMFHNPTREPARYAVVIEAAPPARR